MRVAPPVQARSCGAGPWQSMQLALYALSSAVASWWIGARLREPDLWLALGSLLAALIAVRLARRLLNGAPASLAWDGGAWQLAVAGAGPVPGRAAPMLDFGGWMLVRFTPDAPPRPAWRRTVWLPLSRRDAPAEWPAMRVALHARQPARRAA